jgi:GNAT superfamily N-acetyltransferase
MVHRQTERGLKLIRLCRNDEFDTILAIVNDGAQAYAGVIPKDCLKNPYMPKIELQREIEEGVVFWAYEDSSELLGVMGIQELNDVTLIRHAYVRTRVQGRGIGGELLYICAAWRRTLC